MQPNPTALPEDAPLPTEAPGRLPRRKRPPGADFYEWLELVVHIVVVIVLFSSLVLRLAAVSGQSMNPTLEDGDMLLITSAWYQPKRGDVVVVSPPRAQTLVKRVVALEGEEVDVDFETGELLVNGTPLEEPYILEPIYRQMDVPLPVTVPQGCVFVAGDNRNHSLDSRSSQVGMVDVRSILGKVRLRLLPLGDFGPVA